MKNIAWIIFISLSINSKNIIPDVFATDVSVYKGEELKALVYIYLNKKKIVPEPLIYSGILFYPKNNQKE